MLYNAMNILVKFLNLMQEYHTSSLLQSISCEDGKEAHTVAKNKTTKKLKRKKLQSFNLLKATIRSWWPLTQTTPCHLHSDCLVKDHISWAHLFVGTYPPLLITSSICTLLLFRVHFLSWNYLGWQERTLKLQVQSNALCGVLLVLL